MRPLSDSLNDEDARPWFSWDEDITVRELRAVFMGPSSHERDRLLGKLLREARDVDVWRFVQVADVVGSGTAPPFGTLIDGWRQDGSPRRLSSDDDTHACYGLVDAASSSSTC
jgi:hypothetical protein